MTPEAKIYVCYITIVRCINTGMGEKGDTQLDFSSGRKKMNTIIAPKHPRFSHEVDRQASFHHWLPTIPVKPQDLAQAGFYYLG